MPSARTRAAVVVAVVAVLWGSIGLIVRWVPLGPVPIVFARCAFAALTLTVLLGAGPVARRAAPAPGVPAPGVPAPGVQRRAAVVLGPLLAVHWLCLVAAQQRAALGVVLTITYLAPVLVALAAPRLLGERVPRAVVGALVLAVAGTVLLARPSSAAPAAGVAFALAAAVTFAALLLAAKVVVAHLGGVRLARAQFAGAAAVLAPFAVVVLAQEWADGVRPAWTWAWLVVLGVVHTGLGWALFFTALGHLPATRSGVLGTLEPVAAALLAWWVLGEAPDAVAVTGGALVLVGAMIAAVVGTPAADPNPGQADVHPPADRAHHHHHGA